MPVAAARSAPTARRPYAASSPRILTRRCRNSSGGCADNGTSSSPTRASAAPCSGSDSREKKSVHATEQQRPDVQRARAAFRRRIKRHDARRYVIIDEFGVNLAMTRTYGRAPRGVRVVDHVPGAHWQAYTLVY